MNIHEAKEWLLGNRSTINTVPREPFDTWQVRVSTADAASVQQAYFVAKAHQEAHRTTADREAEYRRNRLEIITALLTAPNSGGNIEGAVNFADKLMVINGLAPIPAGAIP